MKSFGGYFDVDSKLTYIKDNNLLLESRDFDGDKVGYITICKELSNLKNFIAPFEKIKNTIEDIECLFSVYQEYPNDEGLLIIQNYVLDLENKVDNIIWSQRFSKEDDKNCYMDIVSGSGGLEAQDWAQMLLRMYIRWSEIKHLNYEIINNSSDSIGVKSATIKFTGQCAYGLMRTETGVHRLVRCSPFDANYKRHTSFAAVYVYPELDAVSKEIDISPSDIRIDVFRASGAGGQHVNKTESAVRITHLPTGLVVQSQSERSQHRNKDNCIKQLKSKLYKKMLKEESDRQKAENSMKADVEWGSQIRSYVLDDSRIKDLRTGVEIRNIQSVLDGNIEPFIIAALDHDIKS